MSETGTQGQGGGLGKEQRPAVGIVANGYDSEEVAAAILRAKRKGAPVYVAAFDRDREAVAFAEQLGARVVVAGDDVRTEEELWDEVRRAVREAGHPGLVQYTTPTRDLDFGASESVLAESDSYAIDAELRSMVRAGPEVLVAIPAYNEGDTIADVVSEALPHADEVLVVDDGSTDDTVERARSAGATVVEHDHNRGYGSALRTAFEEADRGGAEHLVVLDGDGQHDPGDVPRLVEVQQERDAEVVIGCRFGEDADTDLPLYRRFGIGVVNVLTNLSLGVLRPSSRIRDTQSGFRAYDAEAIVSLAAADDIGDHMGASTDILHHAHVRDYDIVEVGTTVDYDVDDASSQSPLSHGLTLIFNLLRTIERERPVMALGVPGLLSTLLGIGFGYWTIHNYFLTDTFSLGLAVVSTFFVLAGILSAFTAIILHSLSQHQT